MVPTTTQGAFVNAIPNGDFEGGSGAGGWTFTDPGGVSELGFSTYIALSRHRVHRYSRAGSIGAGGAQATMTSYSLVTPGQSVTASAYVNPNNNGANLTIWIQLNWYNSTDSLLSTTGQFVNEQEGFGYRKTQCDRRSPPRRSACARVDRRR